MSIHNIRHGFKLRHEWLAMGIFVGLLGRDDGEKELDDLLSSWHWEELGMFFRIKKSSGSSYRDIFFHTRYSIHMAA